MKKIEPPLKYNPRGDYLGVIPVETVGSSWTTYDNGFYIFSMQEIFPPSFTQKKIFALFRGCKVKKNRAPTAIQPPGLYFGGGLYFGKYGIKTFTNYHRSLIIVRTLTFTSFSRENRVYSSPTVVYKPMPVSVFPEIQLYLKQSPRVCTLS